MFASHVGAILSGCNPMYVQSCECNSVGCNPRFLRGAILCGFNPVLRLSTDKPLVLIICEVQRNLVHNLLFG